MSFGGGDSPSNTSYATQFQREAPQIEADKLGLMGTARELTQFGMNPWERSHPDAEFGEEGYGKYTYDSDTGPYARGTKWEDLSRKQRTQEGRPGGADLPTQTIADFTQRQKDAFKMADQGIGKFQGLLNQSQDFANMATQQYDPSTGYQQYMNPYQDEVIAGIEQQFGKAQAGAGLSAAQAGAFGGGREGIQRAELGRQQAQTVGQAHAQNYGQAQQQAQQQFASQMGRYGEAAQQMAGLAGQGQQMHQADIASLMSAGSVEQQRLQQEYDAKYRADLQNLYEPYQRLGFTGDIYQGYPTSAMATSMGTAPGTNSLAQGLGAGITALAGAQFNQ
jgi:broad specificity phosphatase PhoE